MEWQFITVGTILCGAVAYLGRAAWRTWFRPGCGSACGGCAKPDRPATEDRKRIALPRV